MTLTTQNQWTADYEQLIIDTYCKGATKLEAQLFLTTCKRTGLEPGKQIYSIKRWDSKLGRENMTTQTSIDGFRLIAERTGCYAPGREPTFSYDKEAKLFSATAYVKKLTKDGTWHEVAATAFWSEYVQTGKDKKTGESYTTQFWAKMPHVMLQKCAETLALRKAFPAELSGLFTTDEMAQSTSNQPEETVKSKLVPEEREVTPEECTTFLDSFGGEKDLVCACIEHLSSEKQWSMNKTMFNCITYPARFREKFNEWKSQQPIVVEGQAIGE